MESTSTWARNEALLRSYRLMFIGSQSALLAVGALLAGKSAALLYVTGAVGFAAVWAIWFPVVTSRHRIVDYHKHAARLDASQRAALCSERDYVHSAKRRREANAIFGLDTHWRTTRVRIDLGMPLVFSILWIALAVYEAMSA